MRTLWKFTPPLTARFDLQIPGGYAARVRHLGLQRGIYQLWVEVDPGLKTQPVQFHWFGTGQEADLSRLTYVGTATKIASDDSLILHLYQGALP